MGKTARDEKLPMVFLGEQTCHVASVGGRVFADIYSDIKHSAPHTSHQFCLSVRRSLKVEPAHHAACGARLVVLNEVHWPDSFIKRLLIVALEEVAASVGKHPRLDDNYTFYICLNAIHKGNVVYPGSVKFLQIGLFRYLEEILAILVFQHRLSQKAELVGVNPAVTVGYTLQAGYLQALTFLKHLHID